MGKRGPLPKSRTLLKLAGNPSKRRLPGRKDEATESSEFPPPPSWLHPEGKAHWKRILPHVNVDRACWEPFVAMCQAYADLVVLSKAMNDGSISITGKRGRLLVNPIFLMQQRCMSIHMRFCAQFGLVPSTAGRAIRAKPEELAHVTKDEGPDDLDEFLNDN